MSSTAEDLSMSLEDIKSEITILRGKNRAQRCVERHNRLQILRQRAGQLLTKGATPHTLRLSTVHDHFQGCEGLPEISAGELTAEIMASAILHHGVLIVRGLYDKKQTDHLFNLAMSRPELSFRDETFTFASPSETFEMFEIFEDSGLLDAVRTYHDGESVVMAQRLKIARRLAKHNAPGGLPWHQDVNFFGAKCYAVNCWAAVTQCGIDNPTLGFIPRREEASIGWDPTSGEASLRVGVEPLVQKVQEIVKTTPEVQVIFEPGDAALFDEMTIHRTASREFKVPQQIVTTSWFFNPAFAPDKITPLAAL